MTAVFFISSDGAITGSDALAPDWWSVPATESLTGRHFSELFQLDVVAETDEDKVFQWEFLRDARSKGPLRLDALTDDGDVFPVSVVLEETPADDAAVFRARVSRTEEDSEAASDEREPVPPSPAPPAPPKQAEPAGAAGSGVSGLEGAPHLGFFTLRLPNGPCRYNSAWKQMLGYAPRELPDNHQTLIKLIHPEDSEATPDHPHPGSGPGDRTPFSVELRMRHKAGHYVWVQSVGVQEYDGAGELVGVSGFHLDIQERKEMEEESIQNEERFLTLIHRGKLSFFDLDFRNRKAFFSPAWQEMLGYKDGDLEAMPDTLKRLLDTSSVPSDDLVRIFTGPDPSESTFFRELRMQKKDGKFVNLHTQIIRLTNRRGELVRVLGFQSGRPDEAPPAQSSTVGPEILHAALQSVNEAVLLTDAHSNVTFFNESARRLAALRETDVLGWKLTVALSLIRSHDGRPAENLADEVLSSGNPILLSYEFALEQEAGEPREIVLSCLPLRDPAEKILGAVLIFRDPLEMSLTPEELAKSNRMESLGLLAGGVAHDFNNLLTSIVGGISLARETRDWAPLENSERSCLSAKDLTRQLLTFARGRNAEKKVAQLPALVRDCARLATSGASVKPEFNFPDDLHPAAVDRGRMGQVFQNLIINAIQGMGKAGGSLTITGENLVLGEGKVAGLGPGDYVRIAVKDTGKGISKENLAHIFEPFFTTKKTGTGLGLSTVAAIVREHDGQITVSSEVGVGTTFFVYLPKTTEPVEVKTRRAAAWKFGTGRILFMDDDEEIATLAAGMLERLEYEFDIARNGEEAIALYNRYLKVDRPYDAVILDLTIAGGMGGEETLAKLRELDPDVRAIVSSGYSTDDSDDYYLKKGFCGVLSKPYRSEEMGKVLREVFGKEG